MTQSFSGIVPALKEEVSTLKAKNTELDKRNKSLEEENLRLRIQLGAQTEKVADNRIIASMVSAHG